MDKTPAALKAAMQKGLDRNLEADDPEGTRAAFDALAEELEGEAERALETLEAGLADATAVLTLPEKYRRRVRTTNMLERLLEELRRRERVIRIFPNERSAWRLFGAFRVEVHESWALGWRYLTMDEYERWKHALRSPSAPPDCIRRASLRELIYTTSPT